MTLPQPRSGAAQGFQAITRLWTLMRPLTRCGECRTISLTRQKAHRRICCGSALRRDADHAGVLEHGRGRAPWGAHGGASIVLPS